ncbi:hypothetical protein MUCCIDRAFT_107773 [Mucor lusitanicus CBS 277.49]|uniref:Uncharacterized protein n=1 Tax=Mucor lusitanicus CBS 277.49 TaxID=747725 RepID=A0A162TU60_MUCCL|nr:hypothetical protein MUCCIDRAFT_107773 [Mucor lusitanicus CBS 277.49]
MLAAKYLKETLDTAEEQGHTDLQLVALISSGEHVDACVLQHQYDYIYTLYRLYSFHLPIERTGIHRCIPAMSIILKLKQVVLTTTDILNKPAQHRQTASLRHLQTYHRPVALPEQKVKRVPGIRSSPGFKLA